jgi:hypothetical protein
VRLVQGLQALRADRVGGPLRRKVAPPLLGGAYVAEEGVEERVVARAAVDQLDGRNDGALLYQFGGEGERAGRHAADVGVVGPARHEKRGRVCGSNEHGRDHGHVRQVRAARVRVVQDYHVALGPGVHGGPRRVYARGHGAQVDGDVGGLRHEGPGPVEHRAGEVEPLFDVGRVAGAPERHAHLVGHTFKAVAVELQQNGVGVGHKNGPVSVESAATGLGRRDVICFCSFHCVLGGASWRPDTDF